jgi:hypothetical protein
MAVSNFRDVFHKLSFVQYPLLGIAMYYTIMSVFTEVEAIWSNFNLGLLFLGLGISFGSLQDVTRPHYSLAKRVFESPSKAKAFVLLLAAEIILFIAMGLFALLGSKSPELREVAFGLIIFGLGMLGMLKTALESAEHHQRVKNTADATGENPVG